MTRRTDLEPHLRERLLWLKELGVRDLRRRTVTPAPAPTAAAASSPPAPSLPSAAPPRPAAGGSPAAPGGGIEPEPSGPAAGLFDEAFALPEGADPAEALDHLRAAEIGDCRRCKLSRGRRTIVFGSGNPRARLMFVGEGPGADEDAQGLPFVGRAGQKLTEMIEKGMGIPRTECYIANIVKCRPPGNRDPEPDEIDACEGFLFRQIDVIRPKVIVALGKFATQTLLRSKAPISALRGRFFSYRGTLLMPTFHPAFLLRQYTPENRRLVWGDLQKVVEALGEPEQ